MAKLLFIKPWGPYKPGDTLEAHNAKTVHMLVNVYQLAVIETPEPEPEAPKRIEIYPMPKSMRTPPRDKMVYRSSNKSGKR